MGKTRNICTKKGSIGRRHNWATAVLGDEILAILQYLGGL